MSGINVEENLTAKDILVVFAAVTEEDNPFRLRFLSEIVEDDDDDTNPSQSLLTSQEALQSVQFIRAFFSSLSSTNDDHFRALDCIQTLLVVLSVKKNE
ncbi:hypothetical protein AVEN_171552-1 [Araneus ventricosus]|uniref:Uncharacterized protein n=1 Tax=Araneus ventricosus TaxID=182803 RepID=A0A4Y2UQZ7_ARAVE|nr:hypothetical protein AVEN_171552-1 [Araneus ventricosus]